jgi:chromosome segregation ATPase
MLTLLAGCGQAKRELEAQVADLTQRLKTEADRATQLKGELDAVNKALADARAASTETQTRAIAAERNLADLQSRLGAAEQTAVQTKAQADTLEQAKSVLQQQHETSVRELTDLRAQLEQARQAAQGAQTERSARVELEKRVEQQTREHQQLQAVNSGLERELTQLRQEFAQLRVGAERTESELAESRAKFIELETQLSTSSTDLSQAQRNASTLTDRLARAIADQAGLKTLTEAQRAELAAISAALNEAQAKVARLTGARGIYTVNDGDSLSSIALYFYRNAGRWPGILKANSHLINNPDLIFPSMVLIIPK